MMDGILSRYSDINFVMNLEWDEGAELLEEMMNVKAEQRLWEQWVSLYPDMHKKVFKFVSYEEFHENFNIQTSKKKQKPKTPEELIEWAEKVKMSDLKDGVA